MVIPAADEFDRQQLRDALEHCTEAHELGYRIHHQLEQLALGNAPELVQQLHNLVGRFSVVLARVACARDQLAGLVQHLGVVRAASVPK